MDQNRSPCIMTIEEIDLILQKNHSAMLVFDIEGNIRTYNQAFAAFSGYRNDELLDAGLREIITFQDAVGAWVDQYYDQIKKLNRLPCLQFVRADGIEQSSEYSLHQVHCDEEVLYMITLYDVNLCKGLSLLQQFSDSFMRDVNLGVMLINTEFRLVDISDMACHVLGLERSAVINKLMDEVFAGVPIDHQLVQRTILDGHIVRNQPFSWTNNETRYDLLIDSNFLKDQNGSIVGAYVIFKDVSNLRSLEEQVQRSDRLAMIGQIAAGTAHEIRNPLTSIKGFLQVLSKTFQSNGMKKEFEYTEIMLTEIDRINDLVSEFLLLSKPKNVMFEPVQISTVLGEILPIIHNEAILHGVLVEHISESELPTILGDRELLKQVFLNISKNGIEAMTDGGVLTITEKIDQAERNVIIEIHDTGPGIPSFLIDKIFDPFFTTKENGTGLGLSVCQRIVLDLSGVIRVSSKGFGTTFTISIPFS